MSASADADEIAGYQNWRHLVFLHWRVDPAQIQALLPDRLIVETYDGAAWLGMVPFSMERVRPWWSPAVPGISWFLETNLRTYVRHDNGLSAVWFFSLDANSRLAVWVARTFWKLNYIDCRMTLQCNGPGHTVASTGQRRRAPGDHYDIRVELPGTEPQPAETGTLEHFLLERYELITRTPSGDFMAARVMHEPYRFIPAHPSHCEQTFTSRLVEHGADNPIPDHVVYSPGVDVRVSALRPIQQ